MFESKDFEQIMTIIIITQMLKSAVCLSKCLIFKRLYTFLYSEFGRDLRPRSAESGHETNYSQFSGQHHS